MSLGAGGVAIVGATTTSSSFVPVTPERILDTRIGVGLEGPFTSPAGRTLQVTGSVPTSAGSRTVVPAGATAVVLNVTAVEPTAAGFVSVRPDGTPGPPATSNLNFSAGATVPNSVTVALPASGAIDIVFDAFGAVGPTSDLLIDVTGYFVAGGDGSGSAGAPGPAGPTGPAGPPGDDAFASERIRWVDTAGTADGSNGAFDTVQAAIDSIDDATAENPALVRIGPGTFTGVVDLVSHVHLEGSGRDVTVLTAPSVSVQNSLTQFGAGTIRSRGPIHAEVRDLTVVSQGGASGQANIAVRVEGATDSLRFTNIRAIGRAEGSSSGIGWMGFDSSEVLVEVHASGTSTGSSAAFGSRSSGWSATVSRSSFRGESNTSFARGVEIVGSSQVSEVSFTDVHFRAFSAAGSSSTGLFASSNSDIELVRIVAESSGATNSRGLSASQSIVAVRDSRLTGVTSGASATAGADLRLVNTMVDGGVWSSVGLTVSCREVFDPDLMSVTC